MESSTRLISKVKEFEGLRLSAYRCDAGVWTIGYGHTKGVVRGQRISRADAERYLREDLRECEDYVNGISEIDTQGKFDAVVDFVFNLGARSFSHSTLCRYIKARRPSADIRKEFRRWIYAGGKVSAGLRRRREWEANRWCG